MSDGGFSWLYCSISIERMSFVFVFYDIFNLRHIHLMSDNDSSQKQDAMVTGD